MRAKFNSDLKDSSITSIAPVYYWKKPESDKSVPYIRWYVLDQTEVMYAGNKAMCERYVFQIDVFDYGDYDNLVDTIKNVMKNKRYTLVEQADLVEELADDVLLYHKVLRYKYEYFK